MADAVFSPKFADFSPSYAQFWKALCSYSGADGDGSREKAPRSTYEKSLRMLTKISFLV